MAVDIFLYHQHILYKKEEKRKKEWGIKHTTKRKGKKILFLDHLFCGENN